MSKCDGCKEVDGVFDVEDEKVCQSCAVKASRMLIKEIPAVQRKQQVRFVQELPLGDLPECHAFECCYDDYEHKDDALCDTYILGYSTHPRYDADSVGITLDIDEDSVESEIVQLCEFCVKGLHLQDRCVGCNRYQLNKWLQLCQKTSMCKICLDAAWGHQKLTKRQKNLQQEQVHEEERKEHTQKEFNKLIEQRAKVLTECMNEKQFQRLVHSWIKLNPLNRVVKGQEQGPPVKKQRKS